MEQDLTDSRDCGRATKGTEAKHRVKGATSPSIRDVRWRMVLFVFTASAPDKAPRRTTGLPPLGVRRAKPDYLHFT